MGYNPLRTGRRQEIDWRELAVMMGFADEQGLLEEYKEMSPENIHNDVEDWMGPKIAPSVPTIRKWLKKHGITRKKGRPRG